MEMWLFFTIFGSVIFLPSLLLFLLLQRFKNTIVVLIKQNGALIKIIINNKDLEKGQITKIHGKSIKPIKISKNEIYYGKWRRWIIKPELNSNINSNISDKEIEEYLNNEDLIKLYMAGKFKDTLILLVTVTLICVVGAIIINWYLINSKIVLDYSNSSREFIKEASKQAYYDLLNLNLTKVGK